jgi:opacity protein-like surface antigen
MRKVIAVSIVLMAFTMAAMAQDSPKAEVFGGYSYVHTSEAGVGFNFNGGTGSLSVNPNKTLGLVADFGGYHTSKFGVGANLFTYLFGPKLAFRSNEKVTPFVHVLFGGAHLSAGGFGLSGSDNAFAVAFGGGVDAKVNKNIAIRVAQVEYLLTKFTDGVDDRQNNVRISTGIVFRFGE